MARSNGALGWSVCGIMMMMIMGAAAQAAPAPAVDCTTVVLTLSDCLTFVTGGQKTPPAACCSELSSVVKSNPQCLCLLFNTTFTEPLGVNITLAQQLPSACNVQTPSTSLCALVGIPVPGPVSPVVAPSPAKSPSSSPASSPTVSSPLSSTPSPTAAPLGSSPSPLTTAPTGSPTAMQPNVSTTPPSPNSAPEITSRNAAAAATLLLVASIFLS